MATKSKTSSKTSFLPSLLSSTIVKEVPLGQVQQTVEIKQTSNPPFEYSGVKFQQYYNSQTKELVEWIDKQIIKKQTRTEHEWEITKSNYSTPTAKSVPLSWFVQKIWVQSFNLPADFDTLQIIDNSLNVIWTFHPQLNGIFELEFPVPKPITWDTSKTIFPTVNGTWDIMTFRYITLKIFGYSQ